MRGDTGLCAPTRGLARFSQAYRLASTTVSLQRHRRHRTAFKVPTSVPARELARFSQAYPSKTVLLWHTRRRRTACKLRTPVPTCLLQWTADCVHTDSRAFHRPTDSPRQRSCSSALGDLQAAFKAPILARTLPSQTYARRHRIVCIHGELTRVSQACRLSSTTFLL